MRYFGALRGRDLIHFIYRKFPYYAINSEIRHEILSASEQSKVERSRPVPSAARLFTIGYEGKTLERYLNQLIAQRIGLLCDVRRNSVSMKFGFSKNQLRGAVEAVGIQYLHVPELGIESGKRRQLKCPADYTALFDEYRRTTLKASDGKLGEITNLIRKHRRVALTCFEADHLQCHRACVVDALQSQAGFHHRIVHL